MQKRIQLGDTVHVIELAQSESSELLEGPHEIGPLDEDELRADVGTIAGTEFVGRCSDPLR